MKIGSILGALSPGLSATGMFGNAAQGTGMGMLGAMSPLLALLLHMKKKKKGDGSDEDSTAPVDPTKYNLTQSPILRAMPNNPIMAMPPGSQQTPFGMGRPPGLY